MWTFALIRRVVALLDRLNLRPEMDDPEKILQDVHRDVSFRGINLWILITATLVASVGLNVNSTPVIIGAMLISPLLGPINGIGVSLAIYDIALLRKALRNFAVAVLFSLATSAVYFTLTPLKEAGSELLARTTPTFWDVLIAFFGGLSGIIAALGRERRTNVIAGVAIATALMPPLCTAGYGIGTLQPKFFVGAMYLFLINAVFISASAYLTFQVIRFPNVEFKDKAYQLRIRRILVAIGLLTLLPSLYVAYMVVQEAIQEARIRTFVENAFSAFPATNVVEYKRLDQKNSPKLRVVLVGEPLGEDQIRYLQHDLNTTYKLAGYELEVIQGATKPALLPEAARLLEATERSYSELRRLSDSLRTLQNQLQACQKTLQSQNQEQEQLAREIRSLFPEIKALGIQKVTLLQPPQAPESQLAVLLRLQPKARFPEEARLKAWLSERTGHTQIHITYLR